jgi:hypothetical protein
MMSSAMLYSLVSGEGRGHKPFELRNANFSTPAKSPISEYIQSYDICRSQCDLAFEA